jgi:hypothetical protein
MTDNTPAFFNDNHMTENNEKNTQASLELSNLPAGQYYFNYENNFNYTLNSFNYRTFCALSEYSTIAELVAYSRPNVVPYSMNNASRNFMLPASTLNPVWAAHIDAGLGVSSAYYLPFDPLPEPRYQAGTDIKRSMACAGTDKDGNQYVLTNMYTLNYSCVIYVYAQGDSLNPVSQVDPWGEQGMISSLVKYAPDGSVVWASRIRPGTWMKQVECTSCDTDSAGYTYITGNFPNQDTSVVVFEQPDTTPIISWNIGASRNFLVCYDPNGVPVWVTYFDRLSRATVWVDKFDPLGRLYVQGINTDDLPVTFYDDVMNTPVAAVTVPATSTVILAKFRTLNGFFEWATFLSGFRVGMMLDVGGFSTQSIATDTEGAVYITGSYTNIDPLVHAANLTNPTFESSGIELPIATPLAWVPREQNREWTAVDMSATGQFMVATVANGYIYLSNDYGNTWEPRLGPQNWSCAYYSSSAVLIVVASIYGVIYRSVDQGNTWEVTTGVGNTAQNWVAVDGNASGTTLVAVIKNGRLAYSLDSGQSWSFTATSQNWVDVAYNGFTDTFVAVIEGGQAYRSTDQGATWSLIGSAPTANWSSIASVRTGDSNAFYDFYATVSNGGIYGVSGTSSQVWTLLESTARQWSSIAVSPGGTIDDLYSEASMIYAAVFDGAMYQSTGRSVDSESWFPTSIPGDWVGVAISSNVYGQVAAGVIRGGQIYIATNSFPQLHTYLIKYSSVGRVEWATYVNCEAVGDNEGTALVYSPVTKQVILSGRNTKSIQFYDTVNYDTPIKTLNVDLQLVQTLYGPIKQQSIYIAAYSVQGLPLWSNHIQAVPFYYTFDGFKFSAAPALLKQLVVDSTGSIYGIGYGDQFSFRQPGGFGAGGSVVPDSYVVKYYPNGYFASYASNWISKASLNATTITNTTRGCSISVLGNDVYIVGYITRDFPDGMLFESTGTGGGPSNIFMWLTGVQPETDVIFWGVYIAKYTSSDSVPYGLPVPVYNEPFQPQFVIGGSRRALQNGLSRDYPVEVWGARTGFPPSALSAADLGAGVISYLGHRPGYTGSSDANDAINYRYLTLRVIEPSLPGGDPQPVSRGSVPYGYIPIFIRFPQYVTGVQFNTSVNDPTAFLSLVAEGSPTSSGLVVQGCEPGDALRLLCITSGESFYFDVIVQRLIPSNHLLGVQVAIEFTQTLLQITNLLGSPQPSSTYLIRQVGYSAVPAFYLPSMIEEGTIHVALETYTHTIL